jgi:DNA-binding CsgD family transcriptional regulator
LSIFIFEFNSFVNLPTGISGYQIHFAVVFTKDSLYKHKHQQPSRAMNPTTALTVQEQRIILLIANGYKSRAIADALCISPHTVKNHKTNICQKLNLCGTTALVRYAILNATLLQNRGGGKLEIGKVPIFGQKIQNRNISYCF